MKGVGGNDCAAVVYRRYPEVAAAAGWLAQYGTAHLTGTGACVFAAFPSQVVAAHALSQLPSGWAGFSAQGRNHSPLHEATVEKAQYLFDVFAVFWAVAKW